MLFVRPQPKTPKTTLFHSITCVSCPIHTIAIFLLSHNFSIHNTAAFAGCGHVIPSVRVFPCTFTSTAENPLEMCVRTKRKSKEEDKIACCCSLTEYPRAWTSQQGKMIQCLPKKIFFLFLCGRRRRRSSRTEFCALLGNWNNRKTHSKRKERKNRLTTVYLQFFLPSSAEHVVVMGEKWWGEGQSLFLCYNSRFSIFFDFLLLPLRQFKKM